MDSKEMWITPEDSEESWVRGELMLNLWHVATKGVSPPDIAKAEGITSRIFECWIEARPQVHEAINAIFAPSPELVRTAQVRIMSSYIYGDISSSYLGQLEDLVQGTSITAMGLNTLVMAYYLRNPSESRTNLILKDTPDVRSERVLESFDEQLKDLYKDFKRSCQNVMQATERPALVRAAALAEIGNRVSIELKIVYEKVHQARNGRSAREGRRRVIQSTATEKMVENFVKTKILGMKVSDRDLHPEGTETLEQRRNAADDITKGNAKVVASFRQYHKYLCDFHDAPDGTVLRDKLVLSKPPGRPKKSDRA